mmetsp:Transcript_95195/g.218002  ORF Transcript_95195/g.218002 Transcript_95195/m.218002 type:complete len:354 (-) Transcript_95195:295-1356(-)
MLTLANATCTSNTLTPVSFTALRSPNTTSARTGTSTAPEEISRDRAAVATSWRPREGSAPRIFRRGNAAARPQIPRPSPAGKTKISSQPAPPSTALTSSTAGASGSGNSSPGPTARAEVSPQKASRIKQSTRFNSSPLLAPCTAAAAMGGSWSSRARRWAALHLVLLTQASAGSPAFTRVNSTPSSAGGGTTRYIKTSWSSVQLIGRVPLHTKANRGRHGRRLSATITVPGTISRNLPASWVIRVSGKYREHINTTLASRSVVLALPCSNPTGSGGKPRATAMAWAVLRAVTAFWCRSSESSTPRAEPTEVSRATCITTRPEPEPKSTNASPGPSRSPICGRRPPNNARTAPG